MKTIRPFRAAMILLLWLIVPLPLMAAQQAADFTPPSLWLEELTSPETSRALAAGYDRILIPTAGIEQNGPHLPLNKHARVVARTAESIARKLGHTLIAPVVNFVPEDGHMPYAGTVSLREETFEALLYDVAESLKRHGFRKIYFLGDSGGNQQGQEAVAEALTKKYRYAGVEVASLNEYYDFTANGQVAWLREQGFEDGMIGSHAAIRDTSEMMAAAPASVRRDKIASHAAPDDDSGADGDATQATAVIGRKMLELKIAAALRQIRALERSSAPQITPSANRH